MAATLQLRAHAFNCRVRTCRAVGRGAMRLLAWPVLGALPFAPSAFPVQEDGRSHEPCSHEHCCRQPCCQRRCCGNECANVAWRRGNRIDGRAAGASGRGGRRMATADIRSGRCAGACAGRGDATRCPVVVAAARGAGAGRGAPDRRGRHTGDPGRRRRDAAGDRRSARARDIRRLAGGAVRGCSRTIQQSVAGDVGGVARRCRTAARHRQRCDLDLASGDGRAGVHRRGIPGADDGRCGSVAGRVPAAGIHHARRRGATGGDRGDRRDPTGRPATAVGRMERHRRRPTGGRHRASPVRPDARCVARRGGRRRCGRIADLRLAGAGRRCTGAATAGSRRASRRDRGGGDGTLGRRGRRRARGAQGGRGVPAAGPVASAGAAGVRARRRARRGGGRRRRPGRTAGAGTPPPHRRHHRRSAGNDCARADRRRGR